ncbi:DUF4810 domain-containing protein [Rahnella sp. SAP-1]|uniref:DUF4810 domain-containing protein n=1 Tax=Rouxiella aceris TaxID=2703884 RepID=A0A848MPM1_9GAMM|nr:DUF4810 domain-containing protein [Rouxiella aceris]NMP29029.1 DUF4810 domain-containing protein [Rouxiella aceris]
MKLSVQKVGLLAAALLMAGCASETKKQSLYSWNSYEPTLYQYYKSDKTGPEQQIAELQKNIEQAKSTGKSVPPGLHAQMGLLYADTGHTDLAFQEFKTEKTLFPESAAYMDFLLKNKKGSMK